MRDEQNRLLKINIIINLRKYYDVFLIAIYQYDKNVKRGFHLDLSYNKVLKQKVIEHQYPFNRKLQSNCPASIRFYKKYLEKKLTTQKVESKVNTMLTIAQKWKLTQEENEYLKKLDNQITMIMLNAEYKITSQQIIPWSPELLIAIWTVTLWKLILTQLKTNTSQHKTITVIQQTLKTTIDLTWKTPSNIFHQLKTAKCNLI